MTDIGSRTVDWWSVHEHVSPLLDEVGSWPMVGTLAWQYLPTDDPVKLAAIFDAARHHALRIDTDQEMRAQASRDVAEAVDCQAIARGVLRTQWCRDSGVHIPRKVTT